MTHPTVPSASVPTHATVELRTTVGLDLSDRVSHFHAMSGDGRTLSKGRVAMQRHALSSLFERWKDCRLVIEAGGHSPWVSRLATQCGMEAVTANPRRLELISKSDYKTDRSDAEMLADLGRTNIKLLAPIQHRSDQAQADLCVLRARDELVRTRTGLINHVRGVMKSNGHRAVSCSAESFARKLKDALPAELAPGLGAVLETLNVVSAQIRELDKKIETLCEERYPITKELRRIGGIGPVVALTFVLTIEDPQRFKRSRDVGPYVGMTPRKRSSGDDNPQLRITKAGDRQMRRLLVLAANYVLGRFGPDCDLRRFGLRICGEGNSAAAKKRARVAVGRKLAVLMLHLWKHGLTYDPLHHAQRAGEFAPL